jgi:anion transporter
MTDPLDMHQYRIEKLPKRTKGGFEKLLASAGPWLALAAFILLGFFIHPSFLQSINPDQLSSEAKKVFEKIGETQFIQNNTWMLAIFAASLILWMTEAIPNYLTSLILIISLVLTGVLTEKEAFAQLGHPVMWLNIMSFVLSSMLVATGLAKRFALWFLIRFGKNAATIFLSFLVINLVLSAFISATTAKAAILLPIFMVVAAIYGARGSDQRNNFGRSIVLQNLLYINLGASGFMTGSGANLLAITLIAGATSTQVFFSDWLMAMFPMAIILMLLGYILAMRVFFPLKPEERIPQIEGGMERLKQELRGMGNLTVKEIKAIVLFVLILLLWSTDRWHGISPTAVAFMGGIVALLPGIGIIQ